MRVLVLTAPPLSPPRATQAAELGAQVHPPPGHHIALCSVHPPPLGPQSEVHGQQARQLSQLEARCVECEEGARGLKAELQCRDAVVEEQQQALRVKEDSLQAIKAQMHGQVRGAPKRVGWGGGGWAPFGTGLGARLAAAAGGRAGKGAAGVLVAGAEWHVSRG